jgi:hypothetical protein
MRLAPLRRGLFFGAYDRLAPLRAHIAVADLRGSDEGVDCIADRLGINRLYHACLEMDSRPTEPGLLGNGLCTISDKKFGTRAVRGELFNYRRLLLLGADD